MGLTPRRRAVVLVLAGASLVVYGLYLVWPPLAPLAAGAALLGVGALYVDVDGRP